jgi:hypothetical protein
MCECKDLDVVQIFPCDCEDLSVEPIQCCCSSLSIIVTTLSFGYNEATAKPVEVTNTCPLPIEYIAEPSDTFIHVSMTQNGFNVSMDANPTNSPRNGSIGIKFNNETCHTITINQEGKPCDCNNLTLTQK